MAKADMVMPFLELISTFPITMSVVTLESIVKSTFLRYRHGKRWYTNLFYINSCRWKRWYTNLFYINCCHWKRLTYQLLSRQNGIEYWSYHILPWDKWHFIPMLHHAAFNAGSRSANRFFQSVTSMHPSLGKTVRWLRRVSWTGLHIVNALKRRMQLYTVHLETAGHTKHINDRQQQSPQRELAFSFVNRHCASGADTRRRGVQCGWW